MRVVSAWQIRNLLLVTAVTLGLYLVSYLLVWAVITPLQTRVLPELTLFASLLFLPHGVRVFATSLIGVRSVPGLVLGELAGNCLFWNLGAEPMTLIAVSLASGSVTWLVFEGLRALRINAYYLKVTDEPPPLHLLLLAGILASAANAFLATSILEGAMGSGEVTRVLAALMTGDVTGLLAVMIAARHGLPLVNRVFP